MYMRNAKIIRSAANIIKQNEIKHIYTTHVSKVSLKIIVLFHSSRRTARARTYLTQSRPTPNPRFFFFFYFLLSLFAYYYFYCCRLPTPNPTRLPPHRPTLNWSGFAARVENLPAAATVIAGPQDARRDTTVKRLYTITLSWAYGIYTGEL